MAIRLLSLSDDLQLYGEWVRTHAEGTLWQSTERLAYLQALGKEVRVYVDEQDGTMRGSALVVIDKTSFGLSTWDMPRGPIGESQALLEHITHAATEKRCLALYFSPLRQVEFAARPSARHIHCEATRIIDLTQTEEEILMQMKQKGRYNIRVAEKKGVEVHQSDQVGIFYDLAKQTGARDAFTTLSQAKYEAFLRHVPGSFLLLAYDQAQTPIAGLIGVVWNGRGIYYYGASSYAHRAVMGPYALQWAAMRHCKAEGCTSYDLLGVAPPDADKDHPWQGITGFKEKFGGELVQYPPEQEMVLRPYAKRLLEWKRRLWR